MRTYHATTLHSDERFFAFQPYEPTAPLTRAAGPFTVSADDAEEALAKLWEIGNKMDSDDEGAGYPPDLRSLSVGDVVVLMETNGAMIPYSVDRAGFSRVGADDTSLPNPIGPRTTAN